MKPLAVVALCCVCLIAGYCGATEVHDRRARVWLGERDTLLTTVAVVRAERDAALAIATAPDTVRLPARRPVPIPRTTVPNPRTVGIETSVFDSLQKYKSLTDTLLQGQAVLHDRIGRDSVKLAAFARTVARDTVLIDSLTALVSRAPVGRKRGINLLGLRLCPTVGFGYGLTADGRHSPVVAVVQPLSCG